MEQVKDTDLSAENQEVEPQAEPETQVNGEVNGHDPAPEPLSPAAATLAGDLAETVLSIFRDYREPYHQLDNHQKQRLTERAKSDCDRIADAAVKAVAAVGFPAFTVSLDQLVFKPNMTETKLSVLALDRATRHALVDSQGKQVLMVLADPAAFRGARVAAKVAQPEPEAAAEEPELPLGEGLGETEELAPDEPAQQTEAESPAYAEGAEDRVADKAWDCNPFKPGSLAYARYIAGWLDQEIDGLAAAPKQQKLAKTQAHQHFREMGRDAALAGQAEEANPFPIGWRYRDSWAEGWIAGRDAAAALAASDAASAAANGEAAAP